ncbi:MAG: hypothetical protein Kow0019_11720 [Methanobacteriaceae archaeon]
MNKKQYIIHPTQNDKASSSNENSQIEYLPVEEFLKECKTIALASQLQVKEAYNKWKENGDSNKPPTKNKAPAINWDKSPEGYIPFKDNNCGTAIPMTYIPTLDLHPVVIDLDIPKAGNKHHIKLDKLKEVCKGLFDKTLCKETGSGGIHIYLLSRSVPKMKAPRFNLDYQCNPDPENRKGKYVVFNWRWDVTGQHKECYTKLDESPDEIAIVDSADDVLELIMESLDFNGYIKDDKAMLLEDIAKVVKPAVIEGTRQMMALALAGYLKKQGYTKENLYKIFKMVFKGDEEFNMRLKAIDTTYAKDNNEINGWSTLKDYLSPMQQDKLQKLTKNNYDDIKQEIINKLLKHTEPSVKLFFDYISMQLDLYVNPSTLRTYEKLPDGSIQEIDENRVIDFFIKEFGTKSISQSKAEAVLRHIIQPLNKDYNLIEFANGVLNTRTQEFNEVKTLDKIPKMTLPFKWNPEADGGEIEEIIDSTLTHPDHPKNKERWLRAVGHAFMGVNRIGKLTIVVGPSNTGKSTLTTILERIFSTSKVTINEINKNERFTLYDMVDRDINIDDDINNGILKGIGSLNSVVTGNSLSVEQKHSNKKINLRNPEIPRLFANGNSLPPVIGEGFERRLLLIFAKNVRLDNQINETLQNDILNGEYDQELEWFVHTAITTYWNKMNERITSTEETEEMKRQYEFQSYPLQRAIEQLFEDNYNEDKSDIDVSKVNNYLKIWCRKMYQAREISKEHKRPSNTQIKKAMDFAGYEQVARNVIEYDEDGCIVNRTTKRVYENIKLKEGALEYILS